MSKDTIYRQDAINEIEERKNANGYRNVAVISELNRLEGYIMQLPSAHPERKKGKWIEKEDPYGFFNSIPVCSECGCTTKMRERYNFCPNCGADLRGEQDDSV